MNSTSQSIYGEYSLKVEAFFMQMAHWFLCVAIFTAVAGACLTIFNYDAFIRFFLPYGLVAEFAALDLALVGVVIARWIAARTKRSLREANMAIGVTLVLLIPTVIAMVAIGVRN